MQREYFPDSTPIEDWFYDETIPSFEEMGTKYVITDYGIRNDGNIYTKEMQALIDLVHQKGGGVIIVPKGLYYTGALFFKQGVNLYIEESGILKGSDDISDYKVLQTRIEGENCLYFSALINADGVDNFTICGRGTIDGNGEKSWKAFWLRREWNPNCTNKDEQRPRLIYISNSSNVTIAGLRLQNSHFWTNHVYKCDHVRFLNCSIYSQTEPIRSPSTDAIDIDVCTDVLIKGCWIHVNDDGIALKGGKGPNANMLLENGLNERILIEDCTFDYCHGCLTCGSESIHNRNVIMRRIKVHDSTNFLMLKMRLDTPQLYEYIDVTDAEGKVSDFVNVFKWTQFSKLGDKEKMPQSLARNITISNCSFGCKNFFRYASDQAWCKIADFALVNLQIKTEINDFKPDSVENICIRNVSVAVVDGM